MNSIGASGAWKTVVGIAADVRNAGLFLRDDPEYYLLQRQASGSALSTVQQVILRSPMPIPTMSGLIRAEIRAMDPLLPISVETLGQRIHQLSSQPRFNTLLLGLFAGIGVLLAAVGLAGVMSLLVTQRTQELGVRMALGAQSGQILTLVIGRAARWTVAGLVLGLAGAVYATRWVQTLLFDVKATDPATYAGVVALLIAVALAAAWIPARRASRLDPLAALRHE